jgi:hypothetical protein
MPRDPCLGSETTRYYTLRLVKLNVCFGSMIERPSGPHYLLSGERSTRSEEGSSLYFGKAGRGSRT